MPRTILHVAEILAWADEQRKRTGKFPTCDDGTVLANPLENWHNIDNSLREGRRGLPGKWSLPQLLAEFRGYRNRQQLPKYTVSKILQWADAHKRTTGRWPKLRSGPIHDAPGETWSAVEVALIMGARGLPGGSSLAKLLVKHRGIRNQANLPRLSISRILRWITAHKRRIGHFPLYTSGPIPESPGDTWVAVDQALKRGLRGLAGGLSLARLLRKHFGIRRHLRRPNLSIQQILKWADAHKNLTGKWPKEESGKIPGSSGETWRTVQKALYRAQRGLPAGWSLAKLLAKHRHVRNPRDLPPLNQAQIRKWILEYCRRHGHPPTRNSGIIPKTNGQTWQGVDMALHVGLRGLPGGSSLAKLKRSKNLRQLVARCSRKEA